MSLFRRAVAVNVTVLVMAALLLALSPATISATVTRSEWIVLAAGTAAVIVVNLLLLRRVFGPLERLERVMGRIDPHEPGRRIGEGRGDREIASVSRAFNAMLDRLERERTDGRRRALRAQEAERGRVARELHDEVGQLLTGVILQLEGLAAAVPASRRGDVAGIQDNVREGVQTVREIARGLRPPALDEFGLRASLVALARRLRRAAGLKVRHRIDPTLPPLDAETELALYRVAQEAITNVARHARAHEMELLLRSRDHAVVLTVADDGRGISTDDLNSSHGVAGMRERALLVGGTSRSGDARRMAPRYGWWCRCDELAAADTDPDSRRPHARAQRAADDPRCGRPTWKWSQRPRTVSKRWSAVCTRMWISPSSTSRCPGGRVCTRRASSRASDLACDC